MGFRPEGLVRGVYRWSGWRWGLLRMSSRVLGRSMGGSVSGVMGGGGNEEGMTVLTLLTTLRIYRTNEQMLLIKIIRIASISEVQGEFQRNATSTFRLHPHQYSIAV